MSGALACVLTGPGERDLTLQSTQPSRRALMFLCACLSACLVALIGGMLSHASGSSLPEAVLYGGSAFAVWMTLSISVLSAFSLLE